MSSKEEEYRELFLSEAHDNYEQLNKLFTALEKNIHDKQSVDSIFRITHTLKGNAMGMGFNNIAELAHVMEEIFSAVKNGNILLNDSLFDSLFRANDKLGELIEAIKTKKRISYKGLKTKLEVVLRNAIEKQTEVAAQPNKKKESESQETQISEEKGSFEILADKAILNKKADLTEASPENLLESLRDQEIEIGNIENTKGLKSNISFSDLVQVPVRKLDNLMNQVGQLIIERDRLIAINGINGSEKKKSSRKTEFSSLQRITSELQYSVMDIRLVQIGFLFNKFHRIARDVAQIENKNVNLELQGTEIEIDRNVLKTMSDSLIHIVRNAVSHGIESKEERKRLGKPESGTILLKARNEKDNVVIEVTDDGKGIDIKSIRKKIIERNLLSAKEANILSDNEVLEYIFEAGFSNANKITEVSGRGVGMDVVKKATESIGGQISINTFLGEGTTISLTLPSSLAVKGALLFELNNQEFAFALSYTEAVISLTKQEIHKINSGLMARYLDKTISIIFLKDLFEMKNLSEVNNEGAFHKEYDNSKPNQKLDVIVVSYANKYIGIVVDKLLYQKEIVEKTLPKPIDKIKLLSGTTILGNGNICLVVDVAAITDILFKALKNKKIKETT